MFKSIIIASLLCGGYALADDSQQQPARVSVPLSKAYIPAGFDSNDRAQFVIEGFFPNTCYRVGPYEKKMNSGVNEITVNQTAYKYKGACLMMLVPFTQTIQVGILKADTYKIKDEASGTNLGELPVQTAKNSGPDDHMYASISEAYVGTVDGAKREIVLQGELPSDCWELKEKQVMLDGERVIAVLPIIEQVREANCSAAPQPFVTTAELPVVKAGRYLLHVRSLNGLAINKLVDL